MIPLHKLSIHADELTSYAHPTIKADYDPSRGGSGVQAYFADMLLDSDRNAQYFKAIVAIIQEFVHDHPDRKPVVLDAGCGTGFLTACALVAGAERVIAVDVDRTHIEKLPERLGSEYMQRVTPMYIQDNRPNPFASVEDLPELKFDILISELLGTFSNSESAFKYLGEYSQHMKRHSNGKTYVVPRSVTQTVRAFEPEDHIRYEIDNRFKRQYMPTELVGWLYQLLEPSYLPGSANIVVRNDDFSRYPFQCILPPQTLTSGYYVAEWTAELWGGISLTNSWNWAYSHTTDGHSKHARARAWGLMCFAVPPRELATVNATTVIQSDIPIIHSVHNGRQRPYTIKFKEDRDDNSRDDRRDDVRLANPTADAVEGNDKATEQMFELLEQLNGHGSFSRSPDLQNGFVSAARAATGIPTDASSSPHFFPKELLSRTTVHAVMREFLDMGLATRKEWVISLDYAGVLPLLFTTERAHVLDVPVRFVPPPNMIRRPYRLLTVGYAILFLDWTDSDELVEPSKRMRVSLST